jgi:hypothetical protein
MKIMQHMAGGIRGNVFAAPKKNPAAILQPENLMIREVLIGTAQHTSER